ncbi:MAG: hypothetical protein HY754_07660 [Nitrospirae bacterium]|nr:hypothetical protein [Nitrospirota bacterium]
MEKASVLLIIIIGILSYSNTFNIPFQFDDGRSIVENPGIKNYSFQLSDVLKTRFVGFLTFVLNYKLNGLNVIGYHILNLTIHILNAILVYRLVMLTLRVLKYQRVKVSKYQSSEDSDTMTLGHSDTHLIALFSALLFVSHPIQTQAVTYIVQIQKRCTMQDTRYTIKKIIHRAS